MLLEVGLHNPLLIGFYSACVVSSTLSAFVRDVMMMMMMMMDRGDGTRGGVDGMGWNKW
jgi:hypothetical protein